MITHIFSWKLFIPINVIVFIAIRVKELVGDVEPVILVCEKDKIVLFGEIEIAF